MALASAIGMVLPRIRDSNCKCNSKEDRKATQAAAAAAAATYDGTSSNTTTAAAKKDRKTTETAKAECSAISK